MAEDPSWDEIFTSQPASSPAPRPDVVAEREQPLTRRALRESRGAGRATGAARVGPASEPERARPADAQGGHRRARDDERPPRRPRRRKLAIWLGVLLGVLLIGGVGVAWAWANFEPQIRTVMGWEEPIDYEGGGHGEVTVVINAGDGGDAIASTLAEAGVTRTWEAFYKLLLVQDPQVEFFPGHYLLKEEMSAQAALDALQDPANKVEASLLLHEGRSIDQALEVLAEGTGLPLEDFTAAAADPTIYGVPAEAPSLEGYLFPARYTFEPGIDAQSVLRTMVDRTFQSLDAAGVPATDRHRVLTIASLIQREAGANPEDFYKVSRVIQNRLDSGMMLQFDSTSHYGYAWKHGERLDGGVFSTSDELSDDNPYNTYAHTGLPIGPIGAAGDLAIDAALKPAEGAWLFFVTVNLDTGETRFTNTNAEHSAAVKELQNWCRETQSPNCD